MSTETAKTRKSVIIRTDTEEWIRVEAARQNISQGELLDKLVSDAKKADQASR